MRIHIVQKGDTLWKIAKKYGVDFEQLKSMNTQLSNPDMIMPGMKIKVPQGTKQVKKETPKKEAPKQQVTAPKKEMPSQPPYKDTSPKPIPKIKEDEKKPVTKGVMEKPMKPMQPINMTMPITMPSIDQQMQNYYTTFHLPQMPMPQPKEEAPKKASKEEVKGEKMEEVKGMKSPEQAPMPQQPYYQPMQPQQMSPQQMQPQQMQPQQMQPQLVHTDYYCCPPYPVMMPMQMPMHHQPMPMQQPMPMMGDESGDDMVQGVQAGEDCGCEGEMGPQGYGPMMGPWVHHPHGYHQPWQQAPYGGMQHPMGYGPQQPPHMGWGQPQQGYGPQQMGPWDPQQMGQGYQQPWRDDDVDES